MHPILVQLGPVTISSYGVAMALAFLAAVGLASHVTARSLRGCVPLSAAQIPDLACWALTGGLIGGRALYVLLHWDLYRAAPLEMIKLWHGGLMWYGGFLGGLVSGGMWLRSQRVSWARAMDQVSPFFLGLGHAIGRIGCYFNGCCLGITRIPIQLIESAGLLFLYIGLRALQRPAVLRRRPGAVFGAYLIGYGALRWLVEYGRLGQPIVWAGLTLPQFISGGLFVVGLIVVSTKHQIPSTKQAPSTKSQAPNR